MMRLVNVSAMEETVNAVVSQTQELTSAIEDERASRVKLMALVLSLARPALRSMSGRIRTSYVKHRVDCYEEGHYELKGVWLDGHRGKPGAGYDDPANFDDPDMRGGSYVGWDIYWLVDGTLLEVTYSGHWSAYERDAECWDSKCTVIGAEATAEHLVEGDHDDNVRQNIQKALSAQLDGKAKTHIGQARKRAEQLDSILALASK